MNFLKMMVLGMVVFMPSAFACDEAKNAMNDLEAALMPKAGMFEAPPPQAYQSKAIPPNSLRQAPASTEVFQPRREGFSVHTGDTTAIVREKANM